MYIKSVGRVYYKRDSFKYNKRPMSQKDNDIVN